MESSKPSDRPIIKVKNSKTGEFQDGYVVKVTDTREPFSYLTLEDGTEITLRNTVVQVIRLIDVWDDTGNPSYNLDLNCSIKVTAPPGAQKPKSK